MCGGSDGSGEVKSSPFFPCSFGLIGNGTELEFLVARVRSGRFSTGDICEWVELLEDRFTRGRKE